MDGQLQIPEEIELLEFFGVDPIDRVTEDGYWCYELSDERGVTLRLSFNIYERSVQTVLSVGGSVIATVVQEGAERMLLREGKVRCEFSTGGDLTMLTVDTGPNLSVTWSTLVVREL